MLSDPILACSNVSPSNCTDVCFALIERGNCTFAEKVAAVQKANFSGAIIINMNSDDVFPMGSNESNSTFGTFYHRLKYNHPICHDWAYVRGDDTYILSR